MLPAALLRFRTERHKISDLCFQDVFDGRLGDIEEVQNLAEQSGQLESIGPFLDTAKPRAHDFWR
jgi:hypothetical protein